MNTAVRRSAVVVLLVLSAACGSSAPTSPTRTSPPPVLAPPPPPSLTPPPPINFPPLTGPSRTFIFDRQLSYPVSDATKQSRFVLYDNGAWVLQYVSLAAQVRGRYTYTEANGVIAFYWEGASVAGATGTLRGDDTLTVQYDPGGLSDYEDAVYRLMP